MSHFSQKLYFREKAGYSLGDAGANFVFKVLMAYQFIFFTQVMGISSFAAGLLFLVGRFFDAFTDPMMGIVADRTKHKWGRFRPWLVWSALPFAGIFWMTFTTPDFGITGRLIYAYLMYFLLMGIYTVNNVPYCALNGVMTGDVDERTSISTFRFVAVTIVTFIVKGLTLPLVSKFGQGDDGKGWSITIGIFAAITVVLFLISFLSVKERVEPDPDQQSSVRQDVRDAFANKSWLVLFVATLMLFIMLVVRGGTMPLFMSTSVDIDAMYAFLKNYSLFVPSDGKLSIGQTCLNAFGLLAQEDRSNVASVTYGFLGMVATFVTIFGVLISKPLSQRVGKRALFCVCLLLNAAATLWLLVIESSNVNLIFLQEIAWGLSWGPTIPLLWSMIGDAADYSEWKTGRRATGFVFAGVVFALKAGLGLGGFVSGMLLSIYGYESGGELTSLALTGILHVATIYPALFILAATIVLLFYPITKELNYQIGDELAARRKERAIEG